MSSTTLRHSTTGSYGSRALRATFYLGGVVATAAGIHTAVAGARSVLGQDLANAAVESELRFYGVFYSAYGLAVLRTAPQADWDVRSTRAIAGALFAAGLARAGGWAVAGRPHPGQQALLAIELLAPPLVTAWQARLARGGAV